MFIGQIVLCGGAPCLVAAAGLIPARKTEPAGVAVNPLTATAYITNFDDGTISVIGN
jgi:DNA-binding beta-propeller fold protein YncE